MMRHFLAALFLALAALLPLAGQNNPYEIDDECYTYFQQAEVLVEDLDSDAFEQANARLLELATAKKDEKARTLYYVCALKRATRLARAEKNREKGNRQVEAAREALRNVARETGYIQYYYYSFELAQTYYFNTGQTISAVNLMSQMLQSAKEERDEYGQWQSQRYIAQLYQRQDDIFNCRKFLKEALHLYETSHDPTLRKQSVTRLYCDLADTYSLVPLWEIRPDRPDSARINYRKAWEASQLHLDTLRCLFYDAQLAAFDGRRSQFQLDRQRCLEDPSFPAIFRTGAAFFSCIDDILEGQNPDPAQLKTSFSGQQLSFLSHLARSNELHDLAYQIQSRQVNTLLTRISTINESRMDEVSAQYGNLALNLELAEKSEEVVRITRLLAILLGVILLVTLLFSWLYIRNLTKARDRDEQRIAELKEANEKVRLADAAKTRFVQNMSHEVRTPLNAIVGFSQLLSLPDGSFPEEEKEEFSGHIVNNTKMLTMLLDDILSVSTMDSGNYRITYEEGEMHFIAQAAISSAEHRLQPGVRMYYVPGSPEPFRFRTDPRRVQQILINLLTNSCKHTTAGEIRLTSSLESRPGYVSYAVEDTGPGVPADQAEKIFDRFTKLNDFVQGTGLGLSICRDIADRMGARVYLDTSYTGGARFVFELPVHPAEPEIPTAVQNDKTN